MRIPLSFLRFQIVLDLFRNIFSHFPNYCFRYFRDCSLIDNNFGDCVIKLPGSFFFARTSIAACILILKKNKSDSKVLFIDASNECSLVTYNNKLTQESIQKFVVPLTELKEFCTSLILRYMMKFMTTTAISLHPPMSRLKIQKIRLISRNEMQRLLRSTKSLLKLKEDRNHE
ncbi:MAG: N-6 DNA methylase [Solobacterium sp.]|nr:N-6 DNA methylase [Solobacterium sp.]